MSARRALFLEREEETFLDQLRVGEGIVKIKGRTGPCFVKFPLVPVNRETDDGDPGGGPIDGKTGLD